MENKKKENGKLGERKIRQMGNHEENGYWEKDKLGKRVICKNTKWKKEKWAVVETWKNRNL